MNHTTILSYNILEGLQHSQVQIDTFVEWITNVDPDITFYQELNGWTEEDFAELAARCGHPFAVKIKEDGYRMGISAKYEIEDAVRVTDGFTLGYIYARIQEYHVFAVHLNPFEEELRVKEIQQLLERANSLPQDAKIMMVGDFNSLAESDLSAYQKWDLWDDEFLKSFFTLKFAATNTMLQAGYTDAYAHLNAEFKQSYCSAKRYVHGEYPYRIDYAFLSSTLKEKCISAEIIHDKITRFLSDHYPLIIKLKP